MNDKKMADLLCVDVTSAVCSVEIPGVDGVVYYLPASAAMMIEYQTANAEAVELEKQGGSPDHIGRMVEMLAALLCTPEGELAYTAEQLKQSRIGAMKLTEILKAVTGQGEAPNPSSEAAASGSASPTESLPS